MKERISLRTNTISKEVVDYIDEQMKKGKSQTDLIVDLLNKGFSAINSGQGEPTSSPLKPVERGANIDTHQRIKRHDRILIPCPTSNRWVDKDIDCAGCHIKCPLSKDQKLLFEGLAIYTTP